MTSQPSLLLTWIFFLAACSPASTLPQSSSLETQRAGVVKLRVHRPGKSDETAAGVFVGKDSGKAYFITAFHAVKVEDPETGEVGLVPSARLQFYTSPQEFEAFPLKSYDSDLDLAVVYVPVGNLPSGLPQFGVKDAMAGVPVHVIGQPAAGDWSVAPGTVENENAPNGDIHHFVISRDQSLAEGHSGGPVLDDQGNFLGMHTESTPTYGREVKSTEIMALLKAWHVPTDNFTEPNPPKPDGIPALKAEIKEVIDKYEAAYSRMDAEALWKIWPSATAEQKKLIQNTFVQARSLSMKLKDPEIEIAPNGASATVKALAVKDFVPKSGNAPPRLSRPTTIKLERHNGVWVITSVM